MITPKITKTFTLSPKEITDIVVDYLIRNKQIEEEEKYEFSFRVSPIPSDDYFDIGPSVYGFKDLTITVS